MAAALGVPAGWLLDGALPHLEADAARAVDAAIRLVERTEGSLR